MRTILVSVWDKTGLEHFLKGVQEYGEVRLIGTRSTSKFLEEKGFKCEAVEELTKFPEILDGRVKTLHPKVFAGILSRPSKEDRASLTEHGISEIDIVIVNLYPFEEKLKQNLTEPEMIENIDIGGVSLLRAAAKNYTRVTVACNPDQYEDILQEMAAEKGELSHTFRRQLAQQTFQHTSEYDTLIANYFASSQGSADSIAATAAGAGGDLPQALDIKLAQFQELRYGENPHQAAVWYSDGRFSGTTETKDSFPPFEQLQGKELSSNNITDTYCLVRILRDIGSPAACIIKHNNPCGVAVGKDLLDAYQKAYDTDPMAAFGGIFGFTEKVTAELAEKITQGFVEIVAAPDFDEAALKVFKAKKNVRVLKLRSSLLLPTETTSWHLRDLQDFGWIIEKDVEPPVQLAQFQCVSGGKLQNEHIVDAAFGWAVVKHLTSNAIFVVKDGQSLGFGIGQTSRISSVNIALNQAGEKARGAIMASDAFFPATDNIDAAAKAGISVIVQPGGSVKDKDVIAACEAAGITMLFTGQRCFKH
ncbi:MAG: bifunctional phosphoribosylaminoimidazolecarboxamide formyltransferase/IMP cyclohydrolase [Cyanobacteria bacterium SZAS-4]|nr:bifunctional phosphoribosylaminoimidazolecarboxamide formyltransferase/IMP cyclohydrolase [Cyanobacteria bacterium SZAS-4]